MLPDVIRTNRAYQIFLVSTVLSFTGSTVHVVAASWLILQLTGAAYTVPLLLLFSVIPGVVLAPVVGWLADRFDSRMLLVAVDLVSAGAVMLVPVMAWADLLRPWQLYAVEIAVSIAGQFYGPASRVFVWCLAQPEELLAANSAVTLVYQLGIALGALAGGALVATAGAVTGLVVNAASFAVSAVGMTIIGATRQWRERRAIKTAEPSASAGMWRGLAQTARMAFQQRRIRHMTLLYLGLQSVHRLLSGLLVPFVAATGLGPGVQGLLQMLYSLGAVVAGAFIPVFAQRLGELPLLLFGSVGASGLILLFANANSAWVSSLVYFALGLAVASWVYDMTAAQELVPGDRQGRYFALIGSLVSLTGAGVFAVTSLLLRHNEPRTVYVLGAAALIVTAVPSIVLGRKKTDADTRPAR